MMAKDNAKKSQNALTFMVFIVIVIPQYHGFFSPTNHS